MQRLEQRDQPTSSPDQARGENGRKEDYEQRQTTNGAPPAGKAANQTDDKLTKGTNMHPALFFVVPDRQRDQPASHQGAQEPEPEREHNRRLGTPCNQAQEGRQAKKQVDDVPKQDKHRHLSAARD